MELTIDEALRGKSCLIKDREYFSAEAYITPFLERLSKYTDDFRVQARVPDYLSIDETNGNDIWYSRVWVQAVMPEEHSISNHKEVIGMIYALDTRKPIVKIYRGDLDMACLNLSIFQPSFLRVQEIEPNKAINYKPVNSIMEQTSEIKMWIDKMMNTEIPYQEELINENLGHWTRNSINKYYDNGYGKVKLSAGTTIDAYKAIYEDKNSPYYVKPGESTSMWNVYSAFTDLITNDGNKELRNIAKDIVTKPEKTLLLKEILSI